MRLAPEGYSTIAAVFLLSALAAFGVSYIDHWGVTVLYIILMVICGMLIFFFRDPERDSPGDENFILAPADGKVVLIKEVIENEYMGCKATQISIFLSPLDVHVNRVPVSGHLEYVKYFPGKYLMAWTDHASELNERAHFGVLHMSGIKFMFKQITGFMARRIVYDLNKGESVKSGQRFGIMKFSSRMDVLIPEEVEIRVQKGDRTVAGESILGVIQT